MKMYKYAVIVLNYNTIKDAVNAAKSVIKNAKSNDYIICIADNYSSEENDRVELKKIQLINTVIVQLPKNYGYAKGNVKAIDYLKSICQFEYVVIMNPDVLLKHKGTIDLLIESVEKCQNNIIGAQPLVNTLMWNESPEYQLCIRRTPRTILDVLTYNSSLYRKFNSRRTKYLNYVEQRPYLEKIEFEVPSGAFFVIKHRFFEKMGYFDSETFMYCEEPILGYKMLKHNFKFVLVPDLCVDHYHGKSTGSHGNQVSAFSKKCLNDSWEIYMKKYLKESNWKITIVLMWINLEIRMKNMLFR
jgi:GT2 family glycosyltransferase